MSDAEPQVQISGTTLLVVDDDLSLRRALRRLLELERITVIEADDGEAAIRLIEGDEPQVLDAVLTDVAMPTVSGPELIAVLREHRPSLPVVAMTGSPLAASFALVPVLNKPFEPKDLLETLGPLVLTPEATQRRARRMRVDASKLRALAEGQHLTARAELARSGDLMKRFIQLRERMKGR
jgi:CheY-like chemotaxis protein